MEKKQLKSNTSGTRLDKFLQQHFTVSRVLIKEWITKQYISVNNIITTKASFLLSKGDVITCIINKETASPPPLNTPTSINYIYEDHDLVVLNKPAGLLVHLGSNKNETTLVDQVKNDRIPLYDYADNNRAGIVHRLDRMTEGLLVLAKTKRAYESLSQQFRNRTIKKHYYALLKGKLNQDIDVNQPIARHPKHRHKYYVSPDGRDAYTKFFIKKNYNSMTLCNIELISGRTHQIRVHAHFLGHPIIGDTIYTKTSRQSGQLLQAYSLSLKHPNHEKKLTFSIPISKRIQKFYA
ncbi:hypothetical protein CL658_01030 [bacterium]|nr:hypothetical protein [bacterium]|tara:strand:- start:849 stop:1730 length:882 start_codon:yes stop_codon:yes gene_type:complete